MFAGPKVQLMLVGIDGLEALTTQEIISVGCKIFILGIAKFVFFVLFCKKENLFYSYILILGDKLSRQTKYWSLQNFSLSRSKD